MCRIAKYTEDYTKPEMSSIWGIHVPKETFKSSLSDGHISKMENSNAVKRPLA
jgi:hypothetical protein